MGGVREERDSSDEEPLLIDEGTRKAIEEEM